CAARPGGRIRQRRGLIRATIEFEKRPPGETRRAFSCGRPGADRPEVCKGWEADVSAGEPASWTQNLRAEAVADIRDQGWVTPASCRGVEEGLVLPLFGGPHHRDFVALAEYPVSAFVRGTAGKI